MYKIKHLKQLFVILMFSSLLFLSACQRPQHYSKGSLAPDNLKLLSFYGTVTSGLTSHNTTVKQSGKLYFKYDFDEMGNFTNYNSHPKIGDSQTKNLEVIKGHYTYIQLDPKTGILHLIGLGVGAFSGKPFEEIHHLNFEKRGQGNFKGHVKKPINGFQSGSFELADY